ncbi:MAG: glycoside hydrolase, partial [Bacteroidales bacterium]|nr:glycoside hydrolase [Bacteroidales bacterium]
AVERYYRNYLDIYEGVKVDAVLNDSYEAHGSTWSESLPHEFAGRCGYDLTGWLPAVAGYIIDDSAATDAFIYDWVRTNGRLIVENHYDKLTEILHPLGMKRISESHEGRRAFHCDGMEVKRSADIPMSAMWVNSTHNPHYLGEADLRESASVAHIYGQKFVAAESFTAGSDLAYSFVPADLKPTADDELAAGINRFIIHESAHQPSDSHIPGLGLGNYGQWFNRHEVWAELARPWTDYLARSCHLLMQGLNVADIAYLYGERYNATYFAREGHPAIPRGYAYDYINAETLLKYSKVKKGRLVMPSGVSYRLLALDESTCEMSPALLARLGELAAAGVEICGRKPTVMAGLGGDKTAFHNLAEEIWKMDCIHTGTIGEALQNIGISPDVEW